MDTELTKIQRKSFVVNPLTLHTWMCSRSFRGKFRNSMAIYEPFPFQNFLRIWYVLDLILTISMVQLWDTHYIVVTWAKVVSLIYTPDGVYIRQTMSANVTTVMWHLVISHKQHFAFCFLRFNVGNVS